MGHPGAAGRFEEATHGEQVLLRAAKVARPVDDRVDVGDGRVDPLAGTQVPDRSLDLSGLAGRSGIL
jgi:hypothetical protein